MSCQIGPGTFVTLSYRVLDAEGEAVDASDPDLPLALVFGSGELLPGLERALDGRGAGDSVRLSLEPDEAFGRRDPLAILEVDRDEFPPGTEPGDCFEAENDQGEIAVLKVLDVQPDCVVVDLNHPLADQNVCFELQVLSVRPASAAELAEAEERVASSPVAPLLAPESLLKGPGKRYESKRRPPEPGGGPEASDRGDG